MGEQPKAKKGPLRIRAAHDGDVERIWEIFREVIKTGDTYVFPPNMSREDALANWYGKKFHTYVAEQEGKIVGTYILKDNQMGLGSHIANGSFMVDPTQFGLGIGRAMGEHSIPEAKRLGYYAIQFNFVVASNKGAVKLWKDLGFTVLGTIPDAFQHQKMGLVDAHIMYSKL
ncbi:L-azetidine-2-carboxylic acid acetyltransferase [Hondaea fermentalgiana]|uniref:L-azetidine-2-carboxylic acid acetyltransferase n=1 Tax=Hondaea fermentalgiana TaxID=2315210 RepID=A0A2R5GKM7_9STRA|nr:L-azetidine-2-carboxylic acid acetyltransferase [Hondaea fermentalgiana]|eukprot:GBG31462.1 L-azetidine-2-carboxylic acid acetyltransferase [Hondaea fermentalgiana]